MPGKLSKSQERRWRKAKAAVRRQTSKKQSEFSDRDWGLVNHIFNQKKASDMSLFVKIASELDTVGETGLADIVDDIMEIL